MTTALLLDFGLDVEGPISDEDLGTVEIPGTIEIPDPLSPLNDHDLQMFYTVCRYRKIPCKSRVRSVFNK